MHEGSIRIGSVSEFATLPAAIKIGRRKYFLDRTERGYRLLSATCPHMGGAVTHREGEYECPLHGWRFEDGSGRCLNVPREQLASYEVEVRGDELYACLPAVEESKSPHKPKILPRDVTIALHGHACLELRSGDFSLVTDPWLDGPAFLGSWAHYPPIVVDVKDVKPSAIWISHEHSDHFHAPTLRHFDRSTPVYVPDFPNRRLPEMLAHLGFTNVTAMAFGERYELTPRVALTCFEPNSLWNDAFVLMEVDGFRILNINDAGMNPRLASLIGPVDLLASGFSPGASGYPMMWQHLSESEKLDIMERARKGLITMLKQAVTLYGAHYLLPFASHFQLWHPHHQSMNPLIRKNTVDDVVAAFDGEPTKVIDLLAGDRWNARTGTFERVVRDRSRIFTNEAKLDHLKATFQEEVFRRHHPLDHAITPEQVAAYFLRLNTTTEIAYCEDVSVSVTATEGFGGPARFTVAFQITDGHLRLMPADLPTGVTIMLPMGVLSRLVKEDLSWDEALIGYWCHCSRQPDVYHAGFWRLLQAPYFRKPAAHEAAAGGHASGPVSRDDAVAEILERFGPDADRILRRYGLYCLGCSHSVSDTLALAARHHALDDNQLGRMVAELGKLAILRYNERVT